MTCLEKVSSLSKITPRQVTSVTISSDTVSRLTAEAKAEAKARGYEAKAEAEAKLFGLEALTSLIKSVLFERTYFS